MSIRILRQITKNLQETDFLTVMMDETADCSNQEQVILCLRWVTVDLVVEEEFVGLYNTADTSANTLVSILHDCLLRLNLSVNKLRGQCYDGASSMAGKRNGVAKQITNLEERAVYTHCYGHSLNLACCDTIKRIKFLKMQWISHMK